MGDGTTSVTLLSSEFLKQVKPFIEEGVHPQIVVKSFRKAAGLVSWCCAVVAVGVLCCAALRCAALRCAALRCAALCCAVLCCAVLCPAVLCCAVLCCAVLCCGCCWCAVLCCAVSCCAVLCCAVLCCAVVAVGVQCMAFSVSPLPLLQLTILGIITENCLCLRSKIELETSST